MSNQIKPIKPIKPANNKSTIDASKTIAEKNLELPEVGAFLLNRGPRKKVNLTDIVRSIQAKEEK